MLRYSKSAIQLVILPALSLGATAHAQSSDHYYSAHTPYTDSRDAGLGDSPNSRDTWGNTPDRPDTDLIDSTGSVGAGVKDVPTSGAYTDDDGVTPDLMRGPKTISPPSGGRSIGVDRDSTSGSIIKNKGAIGAGTSHSSKPDSSSESNAEDIN